MSPKTIFLGVALLAIPTAGAFAQDCSCTAAGPVQVSAVNGDVRIAAENGFAAVEPGSMLDAGARLSTGMDSTAKLAGNGCDLAVAPNTDVEVLPAAAGKLCLAAASVTKVPQLGKDAAYGQSAPQQTPTPLLVIGGGLIAAGVAGTILENDDDDASE